MKAYTRNDTAPDLLYALTSNPVQTFTGATAVAHVRKPGRAVLTKTVTFDPTSGTGAIPWAAGDLDERGTYSVEVQLTYSNGKVQTFSSDARFYVADELG